MSNTIYFPILKWKAGEYSALGYLPDYVKEKVCPIIELTSVEFDFEERKPKNTLEEHLEKIGSRLINKWGKGLALVDVNNIRDFGEDKKDYVSKIFNTYRNEGCKVAPIITINESNNLLEAYKKIISDDRNGVALRIKRTSLQDSKLPNKIDGILSKLNISKQNVDLVIDLEKFILLGDEDTTYNYIRNILLKIPDINLWRFFVISGTSFPDEQVLDLSKKRLEWFFHKYLVDNHEKLSRIPSFSDYTLLSHEHSEPIDMRKISPKAKFRYTNNDYWYYQTGKRIRGKNSIALAAQMKSMSEDFIRNPFYRGKDFSAGDEYINSGAIGKIKGNATTWITAAVNQHISKVVFDLSKIHGFSLSPAQGILAL